MALIVEDGTNVENANSYIDLTYANTYFTLRGITAWTGSDAVKEAAIIRAMDYVDELRFKFLGIPYYTEPAQALKWPRWGIYVDGVMLDPDVIPENLKKAVAEYALRALSTTLMPDPTTDTRGLPVKSLKEKLGPIETETVWQDGATPQVLKPYPAADRLLANYVLQGDRVVRA